MIRVLLDLLIYDGIEASSLISPSIMNRFEDWRWCFCRNLLFCLILLWWSGLASLSSPIRGCLIAMFFTIFIQGRKLGDLSFRLESLHCKKIGNYCNFAISFGEFGFSSWWRIYSLSLLDMGNIAHVSISNIITRLSHSHFASFSVNVFIPFGTSHL